MGFYKCEICGNIVGLIKNGGGQLVCCGKNMNIIKANSTDASLEKHVPVLAKENERVVVKVGSTLHPMINEHYIEWIAVSNNDGIEIVFLSPMDEPKAEFCDKEYNEVYAYCNLHGLWKKDL